MFWNKISNQSDIDNLLHEYYDFHDSCICALNYISGATVDEKGSMHGIDKDCCLIISYESQMPPFHQQNEKKNLELKFIGLHRLNLIGTQENYFCDITSCYLSFYKDYIIWSDNDCFDPDKYSDSSLFEEPMSTFIVSDKLEWRFV